MINALFDIISNNMLLIFILLPAFVGKYTIHKKALCNTVSCSTVIINN